MDVTFTSQAAGMANVATGAFTSDDTEVTVTLGFKPRFIKVWNATDATFLEKTEGMADGAAFQTVTAGTTTVEASTITITDNGFTISAAAAGDEKAMSFVAM